MAKAPGNPATSASAAAALFDALRQLPDTGAGGFEGFVRDCLEEVLNQRFRLMKSGHQGGADGANDPPSNRLAIGFEGKKFGSAQSVSVAEVRRKIYDSVESFPALDLWVLATTTSVNQTDLKAYRQSGEEAGIAVEVIDASQQEGRPGALALLAASAPRAVAAHLGEKPPVTAYLDAVRAEDDFSSRRDIMLAPFRRDDVGYASARGAAEHWLKSAFTDDQKALAQLHCFAGINAPDRTRVRRQAVSDALDQWWNVGAANPLVLLGDEGVGKTWSFLAWWQDMMATLPEALPLTVIAPARGLISSLQEKPERFLARLLVDRVPGRDVEFWTRRIGVWTVTKAARPSLLLVLDGLNQEVSFRDWQKIVQPLQTMLNGHVTVVMTCRTYCWDVDLKGLANLLPRAAEIRVEPFSEGELDEMLAAKRVPKSQLSPELIALMRVPRYCELAIRLRDELQDSGDITIERLIYEDWRHRLEIHGASLTPTSADFHAFLAREGARFRDALGDGSTDDLHLTKAQIIEGLGAESGAGEPALRTALSEVISGSWVDHVAGSTSRFRLKKDRVPFALALALVSQIDEAQISRAERLAEFLEPLRGTDRGVDILRWAITIALLRDDSSFDTFQLLAHDWFFQQNFGRRDLNALARLIPARPDYFLDLAENIWLTHRSSARDENLFIEAFADAAKFVPFRTALIRRIGRWLGNCWLDLQRLRIAEQTKTNAEALAETAAALEARRLEWVDAISQLGEGFASEINVVDISEGEGGREYGALAVRAMGVVSMLPRVPFLSAIVSWAAARAISQAFGPHEAMGWVLRVNPIDATATGSSLIDISKRLIALNNPVAHECARLILETLATPTASEVRAQLPQTETRRFWMKRATMDADGVIHLPDEVEGRTDDQPLNRFTGLRDFAYLPEATLKSDDLELLVEAAASTDPTTVFSAGLSQGSGDFALEHSMPALARWAPDALTDLIRRIFASAPDRQGDTSAETEGLLLGMAGKIERFWPLLDAATHALFAQAVTPMVLRELETRKAGQWLHAQISRLAGKTAAEQIALFNSDPHGPEFYTDEVAVFATPTAADFETLRPLLAGDQRASWIGYIFSVDTTAMSKDFAAALVQGFDKDDERTRKRIFSLARSGRHPEIAKAIVDLGWKWDPSEETYLGALGSLALITAARDFEVPDLEQRIDPLAWGARLQDDPGDTQALDRFEAMVLQQIAAQTFPATVGQFPAWFNPDKAMGILARQRGDALVASLDALIERGPEHAFSFGRFPVMTALKALIVERPEDGARIWETLYPHYRQSSWTLEHYEELPFSSPRPEMSAHCDQVLRDSHTDQALSHVVAWAIDGGREDWLLERVFDGLQSDQAALIARSFTILRFIDPSIAADDAWSAAQTLHVSGWLEEIRENAVQAYKRSQSAAHWRDRFLAGNEPDQAFAALTLFLAAANFRSISVLERAVDARGFDGLPAEERAIHYAARHDFERTAKDSTKNLDKRLFLTDILNSTHAPWRGNARALPDEVS